VKWNRILIYFFIFIKINKCLLLKVYLIRPETEWVNHKQVEDIVKNIEGLNSCMLQNTEMIYD